MHHDNEKKIPTIDRIEIKEMSFYNPAAVRDKFLKEQLNALYGARIEEKHEEEEWIWVDGYKGMSSEMTAHGGFQYEMNKMYTMPEDAEIEECHSGFHLCLNLDDVFSYFKIMNNNRFFKVRALVRKKDIARSKARARGMWAIGTDKLAAKQILIERELALDEIFYQDKYADWTIEEKQLALEKGTVAVIVEHRFRKLVEAGYSETFARYISKDSDLAERALAVASLPDVSMDMKVFAIMYQPED